MAVALISHPACRLHDMGRFHPECPQRLDAIADRLIAAGLDGLLTHHQAPRAEDAQLARVHSAAHVEHIRDAAPQSGTVHLDPDTAMCPDSLEAALRAAGAGVLGVDLVMQGRASAAFCAVRPPGHHAMRDRAMGFCLFNNVAVAALHALQAHGLERVAIVDFDVHHGNGTEDIFSDPAFAERVLMTGTFQHPFYPYSGTGHPAPNMANVPLAAGSDGAAFRRAFEAVCLPRLHDFSPQILFISAGFDAHREDEMAMLKLADADYGWVTRELKAVADRHAGGRIVSLLEGGYALDALGRSAAEHVRALQGA
jgi:acetoin utilization deacetylase AcuC-like enzyme